MSKSDKANKPISHVIFERFNPNPPKSASNSEPSNADEIITKYGIASRKIHIGLFHELDDFKQESFINFK